MGLETRSFEVYGFKIEVHGGGRRVWPPSFKRFINDKMDSGELRVDDVMKTCNVSQSLVYKWRADVKASRISTMTVPEDAFFSEVVVDEGQQASPLAEPVQEILLRGREIEVAIPSTYPVTDLIKVILNLEGRT